MADAVMNSCVNDNEFLYRNNMALEANLILQKVHFIVSTRRLSGELFRIGTLPVEALP